MCTSLRLSKLAKYSAMTLNINSCWEFLLIDAKLIFVLIPKLLEFLLNPQRPRTISTVLNSPVFNFFYLIIADNIKCSVSFDPGETKLSVWVILSPSFHVCFFWEWMNWQRQSKFVFEKCFIYSFYIFTKYYPCELACGNTLSYQLD